MSGLKSKKLFLLDMDGTLYLGNRLLDGTTEFLDWVRTSGREYLFLTNNSSKSINDYIEKLRNLGIPSKPEDFVTSVQVTAEYLLKHYKNQNQKIFVLGTKSFYNELASCGLNVTLQLEKDTACVVMGFDTELTFEKLETACILLKEQNVNYIAANPDLTCPTEFGFVPDCGSVAQMLYNATGRLPLFLGKPDPRIIKMAVQRREAADSEVLIIGDRLCTDIACGINAGVETALVLSGETKREDLAEVSQAPTWVFENIRQCYNALKD